MGKKIYSGIHDLPRGQARGALIPGCLVLEGGAFRGVYTSGVLDALLQAGIRMQCTIGVSAGALNGINYVAGQIGRSARINLQYRHDKRYVGIRPLPVDRGIIGFHFVLNELNQWDRFDRETFFLPDRRFVAVAANCLSGETMFFEKGQCGDIMKAVQASASMPYVSMPVEVDGIPCLDGGCTDKIPFDWALREGFEKIIVVRTRQPDYRAAPGARGEKLTQRIYARYPALATALADSSARYNRQCAQLDALQQKGRVYVVAPSVPPGVGRLEKNMEKLGELYWRGHADTMAQMDAIRAYLHK